MAEEAVPFRAVRASLADVVGTQYIEAVCEARARLAGEDAAELRRAAHERVDWYPDAFHNRLLEQLPRVGAQICGSVSGTAKGATSRAFEAASQNAPAPVTGYGFYRVGEDGRLYFLTKSEHYHTPVGHAFPGYALLDTARRLGIPNATHNNTRGHITRLLEEELVRAAQEGAPDEPAGGLDRVLNLETGSLAAEAGVKMMLSRFWQVQADSAAPPYRGRIPVLLVIGNDEGGPLANYHGTTVLTQMLRGMWSEVAAGMEAQRMLQIHPIRPNSRQDLDDAFDRFERAPYKIAGFLHEIVMMNYGARLLDREFLQRAYALCAQHDVPTLADEIQSCLWAPGLFLFREYGIRPTCVALGKGFSGGEYPASRLLFSAELDTLPQFGALVTNGQEEIASLAYLITMRWASENAGPVQAIGDEYEEKMRTLAARHPSAIAGIAGRRHLLGIQFHDLETARAFTGALNRAGFDISAQTYKSECPPVALTKLPLAVCPNVVDFVVGRMEQALGALQRGASGSGDQPTNQAAGR
jgi:4-aminobutyrate aminotransferase-like enzyme